MIKLGTVTITNHWCNNWNLELSTNSVFPFFTYGAINKSVKRYQSTLREKCQNTEIFLVRIFQHSDWMLSALRGKSQNLVRTQENMDLKKTPYLDTFHAVVSSGKNFKLSCHWRKTIIIFRRFRWFRKFHKIDLAVDKANFVII